MNEEEKKAIENFKYWIDTNTEKGVCYLPDYICAKVLNLIEKQQKENEEAKAIEKDYNILKEYYKEQNEVNAKFIPVQIIENFIKKYQKLSDEFYEKFLETNKTDKDLNDVGLACDAKVEVLQQLLEKE